MTKMPLLTYMDIDPLALSEVVAFGVEPYEHLERMENEYEALATIKWLPHKKQSIFPITFKVYNVGKEATVVLQLQGDCSLGYIHIVY
ncbi:hypothetical protein Lser_V15G34432 [Lactuca serriola]